MNPETTRTRPALAVSRIAIDRIEGLTGRFEIDGLCPGLNLIHGPNSSGKSRTAAAIQGLFWPAIAPDRAEFSGDFGTSPDDWSVTCEGRRGSYRRNGAHADPPNLSGIPASQHDRYLLTLHTMLGMPDTGLAGEIRKESTGGYNLDAVRTSLGLKATDPKPAPNKLTKALQESRQATNELRSIDRTLQIGDQSLTSLRGQRDAAIDASSRERQLQHAIDFAVAREGLAEARARRSLFDERIGRMNGDEGGAVAELDRKLAELGDDRQAAERALGAQSLALESCGFTGGIPSQDVVSLLRERLITLTARNADRRSALETMASRRVARDLARANVGADLDDAQMLLVDSTGIERFAALTRAAEKARAAASAQEELHRWVGAIQAPDLTALRRGDDLLSTLLRLAGAEVAQAPSPVIRWTLMAIAVLLIAEAIVLAVSVSLIFAVLALVALPVFYVAIRREPPPSVTEAKAAEREYAALQLAMPAEWTSAGIRPVLDEIRAQLARGAVDHEKANRWSGLADRVGAAQETSARIDRQRDDLTRELGVEFADDADRLHLLAEAVQRWRGATAELQSAGAVCGQISAEVGATLGEINATLGGFAIGPATDEVDAAIQISALDRRIKEAQDAQTQIDSHRRRIDDTARLMDERRSEASQIFAKLGLGSGDHDELRAWCGRVPDFRLAQKAFEAAQTNVGITETHLTEAPELKLRAREALESDRAQAQDLAARREELHGQIVTIETQIGAAKSQSSLAEAIDKERFALEALEASRDSDFEKAAAWRVSEFVRNRTRDVSRPPVFKAAAELFSRFTAGSFRLEVGDEATPSFRAVDTLTKAGLTLDRLSSGTRVQLLMAVRLAFIESMEQGPQLPLLLDETLGNTDDLRADAIIDATMEICRRGRQVVYFTARPEEVAKWQSRVAQDHPDVPCAVIDLAMVRGLAEARRAPVIAWDRSVFAPLRLPPGCDRHAARALLNVGPVDPWAATVDGVDLWYLVPDVASLEKMRECGLASWGQFKERRAAFASMIPAFTRVNAVAECRARALETGLDHWRIGRARPFRRQDLLDSQAVTPAFIVGAASLAEDCGWDAAKLVLALRNRRLARFQKTDDLAQYFLVNGFTTEAAQIADSAVRAYALSSVAEGIASGVISALDVDDLLQSLGAIAPDDAAPPIAVA